jgi:predicted Fe-Mo cluster-binding NifX family protein
MKIAISATGPSLDAEVDPRFGRCQYLIIVDPDTMEFEAVENSSAMAAGGAGISTGQMVAGKGVEAVLTGNCGPNAYQVLLAAGIHVITGVSGKVWEAIQSYKSGRFQATSQPTVEAHAGMNYGGGMGGGMGMGRGMGRGMGQGIGINEGTQAGAMSSVGPMPQSTSPEQELEALKNQSQMLAEQLAEIQHRIDAMEKEKK